ncbi:MAG: hypothetical protein K1X57_19355, partial [Gemmataceae bacterium]|nr:hypothetical protein [Gemmataceae bacterium]
VTAAYNTATTAGGGTQVGTASDVTAVNTIVAGNAAPTGPNAGGDPFAVGSSNNVLNLSAALAGLGTLASNGGPTQTIALLPGSPAVNAGTAAGAPPADQRGQVRFGATDVGAYEAQSLQQAKVNLITINGGDAQRSRVTSLAITFDHLVSFATTPAAAFTLQRQSDGKMPALSASVNSSGNVVTLTFLAGDAVDSGSLADGRYTLTIMAAGFASDGFDGDGNGTGGDDYTLVGNTTNKLFRLYGDADGSGQVTSSDFLAFRLAFLSSSTAFDFNGNGTVDSSDFLAFRLRFLQSV